MFSAKGTHHPSPSPSNAAMLYNPPSRQKGHTRAPSEAPVPLEPVIEPVGSSTSIASPVPTFVKTKYRSTGHAHPAPKLKYQRSGAVCINGLDHYLSEYIKRKLDGQLFETPAGDREALFRKY